MISSTDIFNASILIVDDETANLVLLEKILRRAGYVSVETTTDPRKVCEFYVRNRYALILLDLHMPVMDGLQVMRDLKNIETDSYLPVLVITGHADRKVLALKAGAKDFIGKPFAIEEVLMRVYNFLEVRLMHLEAARRREQAETQFIEAQKMEVIGHLAAGVAHDFNNIVGTIMGYEDLITSNLDSNSPLREFTSEIRHASERAAGLTTQLLVFGRKGTTQTVVLDINELIKNQVEMMRRLIDSKIEMTIIPGTGIGRIKANPGYIEQVLVNLVVNARDAMPHGGKLFITTGNTTLDTAYAQTRTGIIPGDYVILSVSDTGTGMSDEVKAHLFEPFYTTKPRGKGTGLGLTTCQTIVQQAGGHIAVYTELGKGTTLEAYFPRVDQPLTPVAKPLEDEPLPRGTETLLVVDDNAAIRQLACTILGGQGYDVIAAANGHDALHLADKHKGPPIRLVVTDVVMPLMDGKALSDFLRTTDPDVKILFTSGFTDDAIAQRGVTEGEVEFLPKPYTPSALARKVRAMLDTPGPPHETT